MRRSLIVCDRQAYTQYVLNAATYGQPCHDVVLVVQLTAIAPTRCLALILLNNDNSTALFDRHDSTMQCSTS
jgi:hypothetical protein